MVWVLLQNHQRKLALKTTARLTLFVSAIGILGGREALYLTKGFALPLRPERYPIHDEGSVIESLQDLRLDFEVARASRPAPDFNLPSGHAFGGRFAELG